MEENNLYLVHHGILGMKWGIRRYQNPDGSLTPAGEKRYLKQESNQSFTKNSDGSYTVPKNYKFYRVGNGTLDVNASGGLYMSDASSNDVHRYVNNLGPTFVGKLLGTASHDVQHLSLKQDARMASDTQYNKMALEVLATNKKVFDAYNESVFSMVVDNHEKFTQAEARRLAKDPNSKKAKQVGFAVSSIFGDSDYAPETKQFYNYFRKNGFDIIPDTHDVMSGTSETASICINPNKIVQHKTTVITKDIMKQGKRIIKQYGKLPVDEAIE